MQPQCLDACSSNPTIPRLLSHRAKLIPLLAGLSISGGKWRGLNLNLNAKRKENIWSVDNELAEKKALREKRRRDGGRRKGNDRSLSGSGRRAKPNSPVLVSGPMLMEIETILQTQEPVIKPSWDTFTSSISGVWKGVGAVFSPFTAEMEPVSVNNQRENLYDCYTLSHVEKASANEVTRTTYRVALNPFGEGSESSSRASDLAGSGLPAYESFDLKEGELLEEDGMVAEAGLVFFEDGSYSRGPVELPVGENDESKYFLSPTFQFEQCLVKGCHKRLRVVHTIEFSEGGANIEIMRVAVYEEQWVRPSNVDLADEGTFDLKPFSQRKRTRPSELTGAWKVFEMSATPIFTTSDLDSSNTSGPSFVYFCTESLKKRSWPDSSFEEQELRDLQDVTILWLPGGVTAYVDVDKEGVLCIGVGWYSDEGINLVMERDYGTDGKLRDVRWKSEVKRRWNNPPPM
ncbi:dihydroorotate dehydrogenase (DUF3598) [Rhynchospora pubera]|uniref:Dihydroorotate dehydrogenase (DUF3598) n=1 Tax=Rhynchospora pubera TaxID=906938 RepID=A0AAV8CU03_9POAL|nr:dihydroorotate dehydrogenase (DUF3598) [Rhynchospora pubera]